MVEEEKVSVSSPIDLKCGQRLKNRIVKAAMAEFYTEGEIGDNPTPLHIALYKKWALGGPGMMLTGHVMVDRRQKAHITDPVLDKDSSDEIYKNYAKACTENDTVGVIQLNHPGRQACYSSDPFTLCPSAVPLKEELWGLVKEKPRELEESEIEKIIEMFVYSASKAQEVGFHGVELHCAHGYLMAQFLSPLVNKRTDKWGGNLENRTRIIFETISRIREKCGVNFLLGMKINSADFQKGGFSSEECTEILQILDKNEYLDFVEISGGTLEEPEMQKIEKESTKLREGFFIEFAERSMKMLTKLPLMVTGGLRSLEGMNRAISKGISLCGVGRPFCVQPLWPKDMLAGELDALYEYKVGYSAGVQWHVMQLQRIGNGLLPDLNLELELPHQ